MSIYIMIFQKITEIKLFHFLEWYLFVFCAKDIPDISNNDARLHHQTIFHLYCTWILSSSDIANFIICNQWPTVILLHYLKAVSLRPLRPNINTVYDSIFITNVWELVWSTFINHLLEGCWDDDICTVSYICLLQ